MSERTRNKPADAAAQRPTLRHAALVLVAAICMGGYCMSPCTNGKGVCWFIDRNGAPATYVGRLFPVSHDTATPTPTP